MHQDVQSSFCILTLRIAATSCRFVFKIELSNLNQPLSLREIFFGAAAFFLTSVFYQQFPAMVMVGILDRLFYRRSDCDSEFWRVSDEKSSGNWIRELESNAWRWRSVRSEAHRVRDIGPMFFENR